MKLIAHSPVTVSKDYTENSNSIKGKEIEEGLLLSSFAYFTRKEGILRKKIMDYVLKGSYSSHEQLLANLKKELFNIWPWLSKVKVPDIKIETLQKRRAVSFVPPKKGLHLGGYIWWINRLRTYRSLFYSGIK